MAQESWTEVALMTVNIQGVAFNLHFGCVTDTIDIDQGARPVEWIASLKGGRIPKFSPEEEMTLTVEAYPLQVAGSEAADSDVEGFMNLMYGAATITNGTVTVSPSSTRRKLRVAIRWTTETGVDAEDLLSGDEENLRMTFVDGYLTKVAHDFTDDILKATLEFKFAPFDRAGSANYQFESVDGTGSSPGDDLAALAAYTTANKF